MTSILLTPIFLCIIVVVLYLVECSEYKKLRLPDKGEYHKTGGVIPYVLYKTGPYTLDTIPSSIKDVAIRTAKRFNSKLVYYSDDDCRHFIRKNFSDKVNRAYESLIPTAYKADLWRLCILYMQGGIYTDFSMEMLYDFDVNATGCDLLITKDLGGHVQISFMACKPKCNFIKYTIDSIVDNIIDKRKGKNPLDITGPEAVGACFNKFFNTPEVSLGLHEYIGADGCSYKVYVPLEQIFGYYLVDENNRKIVRTHSVGHMNHLYTKRGNTHYYNLWKDGKIFKD